MTLRTTCLSTLDELEIVMPGWEQQCSLRPNSDIFLLPSWHRAWWSTIGAGKRMALLVAEEEGRVEGVLPLAVHRVGLRGGFANVLEFSGSTQADVHDIVTAPGKESEVLDAFAVPFADLCSSVDVVSLQGIFEDSALLTWPAITGRKPIVTKHPLPYLTIRRSIDDTAQSWTKSHRGDVRRQTKRLQAMGELTLRRIGDASEADRMLEEFLVLHTNNWKGRDHAIEKRNAELLGFFRSCIESMWDAGYVHFSVLELEGAPISYHYGFLYGKRFYWYKPAYALDHANYSPGKVHIAKLMEIGVRKGWETFDLLTGAEAYKYAWADSERSTVALLWRNRTARGSAHGLLSRSTPRVAQVLRTARKIGHR